mmetsp:Transcript_17558/g.23682  ORF Transcript_17558/g.23682 Transcript_17558/m.23682 type:complete len:251 (-) Transcript_17558:340-1092(-)
MCCSSLTAHSCNWFSFNVPRYPFRIFACPSLLSSFSSCADSVSNVLLLPLCSAPDAQCNKCVSYNTASPAFNVPTLCSVAPNSSSSSSPRIRYCTCHSGVLVLGKNRVGPISSLTSCNATNNDTLGGLPSKDVSWWRGWATAPGSEISADSSHRHASSPTSSRMVGSTLERTVRMADRTRPSSGSNTSYRSALAITGPKQLKYGAPWFATKSFDVTSTLLIWSRRRWQVSASSISGKWQRPEAFTLLAAS